jgi:hypothetical protein
MMGKTYFFFGNVGPHDDDQCRTTRGKDYVVHGGNKEDHEQMVELTHDVSKAAAVEKPETKGEMNLIIRDSMKKLGIKPAHPIRYDRRQA